VLSKGVSDGEPVVLTGQSRVGTNTKVAAHKPGEQPAPPQQPPGKQSAQR